MKEEQCLKEVLVTYEEIQNICKKMGQDITNHYHANEEPILVLGLLKGCQPFMSDLLKQVHLLVEIDYMDVSSYCGGIVSTNEIKIINDIKSSVKGRNILIVEDIVDSGRTIKHVMDLLEFRGAKSIKVATLIDKPSGRTVELVPEFIGTTIPKAFIIGYGLDYKELYRNLNCIGIPKDELIKENDE